MAQAASGVVAAGPTTGLYGADGDVPGHVPSYFDGYFDTVPTSLMVAADLVPESAVRILDAGCALGKFGRLLKSRRAIEVAGVELIAAAAAAARAHLDDVCNADLDAQPDLPYAAGHFDVVTMLDVVEHLLLPERAIAHLMRWVRPGGSLIFSVPNIRHVSVISGLLGPNRRFKGTAATVDVHFRFFTLPDLLAMLDRLGLRVFGSIVGVGSDEHPAQVPIGQAAAALGGDLQRAMFDSRVAAWVVQARRVGDDESPGNLDRDLTLEWRPNVLTPVAQLGLDWAEAGPAASTP